MKTGIELIAEERQEQIEKHGYEEAHDGNHDDGELTKAAMYAINRSPVNEQRGFERFESKMRSKTKVARLIIAGALIAAEIDRLQRLD